MFKKIENEVKFGALFGIITIIAIIGEMVSNGISSSTIWGAIKDIAGTVVAILLFLFAIKNLFDNSEKNLIKQLYKELKLFEVRYSPLVFKVSNFEKMQGEKYEQGFCILKDFTKFITINNLTTEEQEKYSSRNSHETTKFIDLPSVDTMINEDFKICFRTLSSCIYDDDFLTNVSLKVNFNYKENGYKASAKSKCLIVEVPKIETKTAIEEMISLFELIIVCFEIGNKGVNI